MFLTAMAAATALSQVFDRALTAQAARAAVPSDWRLDKDTAQRVGVAMTEALEPLLRNPDYRARLAAERTSAFTSPSVDDLIAKGMPLLSAAELDEWNRLRLRMAEAAPEACAGFWLGRIAPRSLGQAFAALSDDDLRSWFTVTTNAAYRELRREPVPATPTPRPDIVERAALTLSQHDAARLRSIVEAGRDASPADACFAFTHVFGTAAGLDVGERESFLRSVAKGGRE